MRHRLDRSQVEELRELRLGKTIEEHMVVPRTQGEITHSCRDTDDNPSSSEYHSSLGEEDAAPDRLDNPDSSKGLVKPRKKEIRGGDIPAGDESLNPTEIAVEPTITGTGLGLSNRT
jgi:hypothetical protein